MIHNSLCDLFQIEIPIVQAGMAVFTSAELAAAVSNAGGLGSLGATFRTAAGFRAQLERIRALTDRSFAVNFIMQPHLPDEELFAIALAARPRVMAFALGDPGDYVKRAHDAGSLVMHMVTTRKQAEEAIARKVDALVAQGSEAGGFGGTVSGLALIPQVVDIAGSIPVIAAGGIADGRGLAAALMLGAQGINLGTRYLASLEAPIGDEWKKAILTANSEDTLQFDVWSDVFPPRAGDYPVLPRVLASPFIHQWENRHNDAQRDAQHLQDQIGAAIAAGKLGELFPFAGQTVGLIDEILPAAEITRKIAAEAEEVLRRMMQSLV